MHELQDEQAAIAAHDWQMVLTDVDYAMAQLRRRCLGSMQSIEAMCLRDDVTRAMDALERVRETAHRNVTGEG